MDIIKPFIERDDPQVYFSAFADKQDYLFFHIETTLDQYSPILRGRSTNKPSRNQLHAIACILNSTGLWSGHWARHLTPQLLPVNAREVVTLRPSGVNTRDAQVIV